jgi:colicin import membrane protein
MVFSVFLHLIVLSILIVSFEFSSQMPVLENVNNNAKVISAVAVNEPRPTLQQPALPPAPPPAPKVVAPLPKVEPKPAPLPPPPAPVKPQAIALKAPPKKPLLQPKAILQKDLLADFSKPIVKNHPKERAKSIERAMEKELQEHAANSLQQQLMQEQQRAAFAKSQGIVNKYKALILQAISRRWIVPGGIDKSRFAELLIRLAPGGAVLDVQITKSSGDISLDRSARAAVFKASPLPVPTDADAFDQFRQFVLKVKPEDLVVNELGEV